MAAMFENEGSCLCDISDFCVRARKRNFLGRFTLELLRYNLQYMFYTPNGSAKEEYVVDFFMHETSNLGLETAVKLRIPLSVGKIFVTGVSNPDQIPNNYLRLEDTHYIVGIDGDNTDNDIHIFLYKK